jgi:1-acyl-sn-glycerol-3-phosphate acyltransferase
MYRFATRDDSRHPGARRLWGRARLPYEYLAFYFCLLVFGVSGLIFTLFAALLYPLTPRRLGGWIGQSIMTGAFRFFVGLMRLLGLCKVDLGALDRLREEGSMIIAPNHPSSLDAVLVISRLRDVVCIMKAEIWDSIFLGGGARLAGYIRNDSPVDMIKGSVIELKQGRQLLVFPEGTRTRRGPINDFKGGFALIAKKAKVPIQTVIIESNSPYLSKGWPLLKKPPFPLIYRARLGQRFSVDGDVQEFVKRLENYFRQELGKKP